MQTIIIKLDSGLLENPDLDIIYSLPQYIEEITEGKMYDNGYDYLSDTEIGVWIATEDAKNDVGRVIDILKSKKFSGNDLSKTAEIYISVNDTEELENCERVL